MDYCVGFTALDAARHGFRTAVIEDATRGDYVQVAIGIIIVIFLFSVTSVLFSFKFLFRFSYLFSPSFSLDLFEMLVGWGRVGQGNYGQIKQ